MNIQEKQDTIRTLSKYQQMDSKYPQIPSLGRFKRKALIDLFNVNKYTSIIENTQLTIAVRMTIITIRIAEIIFCQFFLKNPIPPLSTT
jgi:hypothetical protein